MICFDEVSKFILSRIFLHIPQGKTVGVIGASGAGKTTFLKLACGLLVPDSGKIYVMGKNPAARGRMECCGVGALFVDKPFFDGEDTVRRNFETLGAVYHLSGETFRRDYRELSERLGFSKFEGESVKICLWGSGGVGSLVRRCFTDRSCFFWTSLQQGLMKTQSWS